MDSLALGTNTLEIGPHEREDLRVKQDALVGHLKCSQTGYHVVVSVLLVVIGNELAVDIAHGPGLRHLILEHDNAWNGS